LSSKEINWSSPLLSLVSGRKSKTVDKLISTGRKTVSDLLWLFPLKTQILPKVQPFTQAHHDALFKGVGKLVAFRDQPNFKVKGKGGTPLSNVTATVQDHFSSGTLSLKWFNCYPSQVKAIKAHEHIFFTGTLSEFMCNFQIINPEVIDLSLQEYQRDLKSWQADDKDTIKVTYPTIEGISPHHLGSLFDKIPEHLWNNIEETLPKDILQERQLMDLRTTFRLMHGKCEVSELREERLAKARERLIYEEFFNEQIKIKVRKTFLKKDPAITLKDVDWHKWTGLFPYELTSDQESSLDDISQDLKSGTPMMRLIQGDVGSGKTTVALMASLMVIDEGYQAAIMCPTESLALQHFLTFKGLLPENHPIDLLIGSQNKSEREAVLKDIKSGHVKLVVGTHALIQDTVEFKNLALAVIDEQHKFGGGAKIEAYPKGKGMP
jgi:ATP-dependent DNA helicase RecG